MEKKHNSFETAKTSSPYLEDVVSWIDDEWGDSTRENREAIAKRLLGATDCPNAVIALSGKEAVGVVSFRRFDLPDGEPNALWIDSLYVLPSERKNRIGLRLLQEAQRYCAEFEKTIYVFTDIPDYYEKLGWKRLFKDINSDNHTLLKEL